MRRALDATGGGAAGLPAERERLRRVLAWLHAVIVERKRYGRLGWSVPPDVSDGDAAATMALVDLSLAERSNGRAHVDPSELPWGDVVGIACSVTYGAALETAADAAVLERLVAALCVPGAFEADFRLGGPDAPQAGALDDAWLAALGAGSPQWLGLEDGAERQLRAAEGRAVRAAL